MAPILLLSAGSEKLTLSLFDKPATQTLSLKEVDASSTGFKDTIIVRGARVHNLKNLSLNIPRDRLVVITGPSGSGKSVLLKHMIGLVPPVSGSIKFAGEDIVSADGPDLERIEARYEAIFREITA